MEPSETPILEFTGSGSGRVAYQLELFKSNFKHRVNTNFFGISTGRHSRKFALTQIRGINYLSSGSLKILLLPNLEIMDLDVYGTAEQLGQLVAEIKKLRPNVSVDESQKEKPPPESSKLGGRGVGTFVWIAIGVIVLGLILTKLLKPSP